LKIVVQAVEAFFPEAAVVLYPVGDILEWRCLKAAGAPLGVASAGDEAGALEDFQVLRDGGKAHVERLG
jgi:hypothetical protein